MEAARAIIDAESAATNILRMNSLLSYGITKTHTVFYAKNLYTTNTATYFPGLLQLAFTLSLPSTINPVMMCSAYLRSNIFFVSKKPFVSNL